MDSKPVGVTQIAELTVKKSCWLECIYCCQFVHSAASLSAA